jgi:5-amino-6-(D-ribitylamino)uracil---L-tyrosine 4-hydroxyphenyl transferase
MKKLIDVSPEIEKILNDALEGRRIGEDDALRLLEAGGDDVLAIGLAANRIRKRKVGDVVTYVVNRNINFTNVCINRCKFCAYRRNVDDADAYTLGIDEIVKKTKEARKMGATEVCIQGGLNPELGAEFYADIVSSIKSEVDIGIHAFSPMEIQFACSMNGRDIKGMLEHLKEKGLDTMPGTAAEILDDEIRNKICPEKINTAEWTEIVKTAHKAGILTTATMLYGHIERPEDQMRHLRILRDIQDETNGFTEFVPLSYVHFNAPLFQENGTKEGATGVEDLKVHAVARIFLDNFKNVQASWIKLGRKFSQTMLNFGANDLGGTLMEENISLSAGLKAEMIDKNELERMIKEASRTPRQRDTLYRKMERKTENCRCTHL